MIMYYPIGSAGHVRVCSAVWLTAYVPLAVGSCIGPVIHNFLVRGHGDGSVSIDRDPGATLGNLSLPRQSIYLHTRHCTSR